jgi:hypothetical protein
MAECSLTTIVAIGLLLFFLLNMMNTAKGHAEGYETIRIKHEGDNQYIKQCGACIPNEDRSRWTKQCVVRESTNGYPLLAYVMDEVCGSCKPIGNKEVQCTTPEGVTTYSYGDGFCP